MTHRLESRMREIRPSGSEGGVADNGHPYPYLEGAGSGDPAYRAAGWAVPDACRLGLGRTVRHDPYRVGP